MIHLGGERMGVARRRPACVVGAAAVIELILALASWRRDRLNPPGVYQNYDGSTRELCA